MFGEIQEVVNEENSQGRAVPVLLGSRAWHLARSVSKVSFPEITLGGVIGLRQEPVSVRSAQSTHKASAGRYTQAGTRSPLQGPVMGVGDVRL